MNEPTNIQAIPPVGPAGRPAASRQADPGQPSSFRQFVLHDRARYWQIAIPALIVQFVVFKLMYPFPDFISDSYNYIDTAALHLDVNLWPIGYARFMGAIHRLTASDTALLAAQFGILEIGLLLFFYTFLYFYRPAKNTSSILFFFIFFNPLFIWLSNAVLSDALFNALSLFWWVQFIWMLHRPRLYQVFVLAGLLGIAFTIRYTAMYYPIVAALAFVLSAQPRRWKIMGSLLGIVVIIPFVIYTQQKTKEVTGTAEFSVFGGWQIANNALYMYDHIEVDSNQLPPGTKEIDRLVRQYFNRVPPKYRELDPFPGTFFIKIPDAPLKMYSYPHYKSYDAVGQFQAWGAVSPIYNRYGTWLIRHYPFSFARYYLWLNTKNYFLPHLEKFGIYNYASDSVWNGAMYWFQYKTPVVRSVSGQALPAAIFYAYPAVFMLMNIYFIAALLWLFLTGKWRRLPPFFIRCLWLLVAYLAMNFAFSIFATPVVLRYQVMPFLLLFSYSLMLLELGDQTPNSHTPPPRPS